MLSLVSGAANKIHIAAAPILMALFIPARRFPGVVNQASREKGKGDQKKGRNKEGTPPFCPRPSPCAAGCDQRESIGHFSPIAPLLQTSRACNNVQMSSVQCPLCETITTGCSAVSEVQQCSPTHLTLPLRWELPRSWGRSAMAAPKYQTTKSTSSFNISAVITQYQQ